jgi:hypothetical protein
MAAPPGDADATAAGVVLVETGAEAGAEAGALADAVAEAAGLLAAPEAAELPDELHAVSSNAVAASSVPAATDRPFRLVKVSMVSAPRISLAGSVSHVSSKTGKGPPRLESAFPAARAQARSA